MVDPQTASVLGHFLRFPSRKAMLIQVYAGGNRAHRALFTAFWDRLSVASWTRVLQASISFWLWLLLWHCLVTWPQLGSVLLTPFCCPGMGWKSPYLTGDCGPDLTSACNVVAYLESCRPRIKFSASVKRIDFHSYWWSQTQWVFPWGRVVAGCVGREGHGWVGWHWP